MMKYIIIGLGNYGSELAEKLSVLGNEVIGVDIDEHRADILKDKIATTFIIDATDETSLSVLPLKDVDIIIVTIGENLSASIRVVALLKKKKVKRIYARAIDEIHKAVLEAFSLDKILTPESDAARDLVRLLDLGTEIESFKVGNDYYILKFSLPLKYHGFHINDLNFEQEFGIKLIAMVRGTSVKNFLGVAITDKKVENVIPEDDIVQPTDEFVGYGRYKDFSLLLKSL